MNKFVMIYWDDEGMKQRVLTLLNFSKEIIRDELQCLLEKTNWEEVEEVEYNGETFNESWLDRMINDTSFSL